MAEKECFAINEKDNVATILAEGLQKGAIISFELGGATEQMTLKDDISYGHKVAIRPIKTGEKVMKYGLTIGLASRDIAIGEHAHIHNIESTRGRGDLAKGR